MAGQEVAGGLSRPPLQSEATMDQRTIPRPESAMKSEKPAPLGRRAAGRSRQGLVEREAVPIERLVGALDGRDALGAEAATLEAFTVDTVGRRGVAGPAHGQTAAGSCSSTVPTPQKLCAPTRTNWCTPVKLTEDGPVAHRDVAGQRRVVGEDGVVADHAVVGHVHVGHDPVVVADAGQAAVLHRAGGEAAELANRVAVTDLEPGGLGGVLLVLGLGADGAELEDPVVAADLGVSFDTTWGPIEEPSPISTCSPITE